MLRRLVVLTIVLTALMSHTGAALAHALLLRSSPPPDVVLRSAPSLIHLWFSEDLNGSASRILVWDRYRHVMNEGDATLVPGESRQLEVRLKPLPPGAYLVLWTSVSSQDGHILHGSYLFYVKVRGPGPSLTGVTLGSGNQSFPDATGYAALIAHWIELLAAITWAGAAAFSALVFSGTASRVDAAAQATESRRVRTTIVVSLLALIVASTVVLATQAYALAGNSWNDVLSGKTLGELFADQYGQVWAGRQVVALIALALAFLIRRQPAGNQPWSEGVSAMTVVSGIYLYALAASGHAASVAIGQLPGHHGNIFSAAIFLDWLHLLADAMWFGGQIYIVLVLIPALRLRQNDTCHSGAFLGALNRFSPYAFASVATFVFTGAFSGKVHIPSWYAFFHSVYGWALVVKMSLIGLMMLVSTYTVFLLRPRIRQIMQGPNSEESELPGALMGRLLGWLGVNPMLGAGVMLATSVMFSYPVPAGLAPAGPRSYVAHAGGLTATLAIKPDRSGPNEITVSLRDARGRPVQRATVVVLTTMLDMIMGTGTAALKEISPGSFSGTTDLGMGGRWQLQVLVYQPTGLTRMNVDVQVGT